MSEAPDTNEAADGQSRLTAVLERDISLFCEFSAGTSDANAIATRLRLLVSEALITEQKTWVMTVQRLLDERDELRSNLKSERGEPR